VRRVLNDGGWLFLIVPEDTNKILSGHVNIGWNIGTLMYNLILHGFDVQNGHFIKYKRNIVAFVQKGILPSTELQHDIGDIERLSKHFPKEHNFQGFQGNLNSYNWQWQQNTFTPRELFTMRKEHLITWLRNFFDRILNVIYRM